MYKILFIGNSHTFVESLPWVFTGICRQAGLAVHAGMSTYPGCSWAWHLASTNTLPNLRYGGYDYVVIQQKSHPFDGAAALLEQGSALVGEINRAGAVPVLFSTWSERNNLEGQRAIDDAFDSLHAQHAGSLLARCGAAWHALRGTVDLYAGDGEHQNPCGAYLNACVLAKTMFSIDPRSLPGEAVSLGSPGIDGTRPAGTRLEEKTVRLLQETAWRIG